MATEKLTGKLTGWFSVRTFKQGVPRENWKMRGDDENISFDVVFDTIPDQFKDFAKEFTTANGEQRWRVSFKIGGKCRWYDAAAQQVDRPANADLDGKRYECNIQYATVMPDPKNDKSPRGYWARAVQFAEADRNPFAAFTADNMAAEVIEQPQEIDQEEGGSHDDLPY